MALWTCLGCSAAYAVGLPACPQCGGTDYAEDGMPKITSAGVSFEPGHEPEGYFGSETEPGGGEQPSQEAGGDSTTSTSSPGRSSRPSSPGPLSPAPTTENPSSTPPPPTADQGLSSSASTTDGPTPATGSGQSAPEPPPLRAPKAEWVDHAVAAGVATPEEAGQMTKAEIITTVTGTTTE